MKLAGMQSYFLPYIGYFQLIEAVDKFINRFTLMEKKIKSEGKALKDLTFSEMDVYWETGKNRKEK